MRQNDGEGAQEKEAIKLLVDCVLAMRESLAIEPPVFVNALVNMIGYSLPMHMDEEMMRDFIRSIYKLFLEIKKERKGT